MELELHQVELTYERLRVMGSGWQARLLSSLSEHGQREPVLVVPGAAADRYVLIDGYRRVAAMKRLGLDVVEAVVLQMDEVEALVYDHRQGRRGSRSALEEGWLIKELVEQKGLGMEEVSQRLGRSRSWVSRRLGLVVVLPESVQELVRRGRLCAWAAAKYLVPLARANAEGCQRLAEGLGGKRASSRQMRQLYVGWREANGQQQRWIEQNPWVYLKAIEQIDDKQGQDAEDAQSRGRRELLGDLDAVVGVCRRAWRRLGSRLEGVEHSGYLGKLGRARTQARLAFEQLDERMEEVIGAGSGDQDGGVAAEG